MIFGKILQMTAYTLWVKDFIEIALPRTVSEIHVFLHFTMATKNGVKTIFGKQLQMTLLIPCGSKILSKSLYLAPFYTEIQYGHQKWRESNFWETVAEDSGGQKFR